MVTTPPGSAPVLRHALTLKGKVIVALAASCVLVLGYLTRPSPPPPVSTPTLTTPEERPNPLLELELQRRQALAAFERIQDLGNRVIGYSVGIQRPAAIRFRSVPDITTVQPSPETAGLGVAVQGNRLVTHVSALAGRRTIQLETYSGARLEATVGAVDGATGVALLTLSQASELPGAPIATRLPDAGAVVTASGRAPGADLIAPVILASRTTLGYRMGGAGLVPPGTPLYGTEGELVAVAGDGDMAYPVGQALDRLAALPAERRLPASLGLRLQGATPELATWFGEHGTVVADVMPDGPGALAALRAGDVVVRIGEVEIADLYTAVDQIAQLPVDVPVPLVIRRDARDLTVTVTPQPAYTLPPPARDPQPAGVPIGSVLPDARIQGLGLSARARLLGINGIDLPSTPARAARLLASARTAVLLYVEDGGERFFVRLERETAR